jgi:serine protease Do
MSTIAADMLSRTSFAAEAAPTSAPGAAAPVGAASAAKRNRAWRPRFASVPAIALLLGLSLSPPVGIGLASAALPEQIERIKPSIVAVGTYLPTRGPRFAFRGTGFVVGDGTLVATNAHVVPDTIESDKMETIAVLVDSGPAREPQVREARIAGLDREHDLALLRISGAALPALRLGESDAVREGEAMAFTGFPIGNVMGFHAVTHRAIIASITPVAIPSANAQQLDPKVIRRVQTGSFNVFQLDATAYPGNSGSPLYDVERGEVRGIINMVFVKGTKEAALTNPTGISFAIPATYLEALIRQAAK